MKLSEKWLRDWIDPSLSTQELAEQLTLLGLEVDTIESAQPEFTDVVVAEVIDAQPHPNADSLRVCTVNAGGDETYSIVCGAPNARTGLKAPLAVIGARLPGGVKIRKTKLRGELSQGMLCSAAELELAPEADGLMELPADAPVGVALADYLDLADSVLEVELTPNRGDCLSVRGVARDLAARNNLELKPHPIDSVEPATDVRQAYSVNEDSACVRYTGRVITDVDCSSATPLWLSERLRRSGVRSINPAVDITNYVMLERGQPMHAFDLDKVQGAILVRRAKAGEELTLLDGRDVKLDDDITVIADDRGAIGIAGIMGGLSTAVDENTRNIFFESALFTPEGVAGKAWRLDAHSDSSHRFERGVDPGGQIEALEFATTLTQTLWGGDAGPVDDWISSQGLPIGEPVVLRRARVERMLGDTLSTERIESILSRLDIAVESTADGWRLTPPTPRYDLRIEEDFIEELARVHGYDNFPRTVGKYAAEFALVPESTLSEARVREVMVERGFQEVVTFSFVDDAVQSKIQPSVSALALTNPISADLSMMRTSLVPGLLGTLQYNANRQNSDLHIFEIGLRYIPQNLEIKQEKVIGGLISGRRFTENWNHGHENCDFFDLKGDLETLFSRASGVEWTLRAGTREFLHPGQSADIVVNGEIAGWIGQLHPQLQKSLDVSQSPIMFELLFDSLLIASVPKHTELSRFPSVRRDLAVVVPESNSIESLERCIRDSGPEWLQNIVIFDVYSGDKIEPGMKSVALGLILQDISRTLEESEIENAVQSILDALVRDLGVKLRV